MNYAVSILTAGSAAAGTIATLAASVLALRQSRSAHEEVRRLTEDKEEVVLQANDIDQLGRYLYENIGSTSLSNYVGKQRVKERVTRALDGVLTFLGTEEPEVSPEESQLVDQEAQTPEVAEALDSPRPGQIRSTNEMTKALEEITYGEVWNGLARMRRYIELQLRRLSDGASRDLRRPVGRLLTDLQRAERIPVSAAKQLRFAINVASAGIHGTQVDVSQAQEAWEAAVRGLALIESTP